MLWKQDLIVSRSRQTGKWVVESHDKPDIYRVRTAGGGPIYEVAIRHNAKRAFTRFQTWLPIAFPLDNLPSGVFDRLMMRSWELTWSAWVIDILDACQAHACLTVLVPNVALDATLFDAICSEQTQEVRGFHKELRDKFPYGGGFVGAPATGGGDVPRTRPDLPQPGRSGGCA